MGKVKNDLAVKGRLTTFKCQSKKWSQENHLKQQGVFQKSKRVGVK
jgi:hypothetical protein